MISRIIIAAFFLTVILAVTVSVIRYLNSDKTIDARLAKVVLAEMNVSPRFNSHVTDFKLVSPGHYRVDVTGVTDSETAGRLAFNSSIQTFSSALKIQMSRTIFTISGYQDGIQIFEVTNDQWGKPTVVLMGPYEGIEYTPKFTPVSNEPAAVLESHIGSNEADSGIVYE